MYKTATFWFIVSIISLLIFLGWCWCVSRLDENLCHESVTQLGIDKANNHGIECDPPARIKMDVPGVYICKCPK